MAARGHLARFVVEVIEQLDLSELVGQYAGRGSHAHHRAVLLGLLIYGYARRRRFPWRSWWAIPGCLQRCRMH